MIVLFISFVYFFNIIYSSYIFICFTEHYLLTERVAEPLVPQPTKTTNYADYTNEVEELTPAEEISETLNPIYLMADYYNPLLVLPLNYTKHDIELVADRSKLKTAYKLTSVRSCFEVSNMISYQL
ncbi:unnamed protein product [Schistosoma curassoni]|uniref:Uncharacterized protein n=1 Tax=Schistosoma curassoni TaxID=6186 RepID=A0A3P8BEN6_9TREM|nr:unnamed protein product [Schistosoma curassoni]